MAWVASVTLSEEQDPGVLHQHFTLQMSYFRKVNKIFKVLIWVLSLIFCAANVIQTTFYRRMIHEEAAHYLWILTVATVTPIFMIVAIVIVMLFKSFAVLRRQAKGCNRQDFKVLNLQLLMTVMVFVMELCFAVGNFVTNN